MYLCYITWVVLVVWRIHGIAPVAGGGAARTYSGIHRAKILAKTRRAVARAVPGYSMCGCGSDKTVTVV